MPEVLFDKEKIMERLGLNRNAFYELAALPGCPIKKISKRLWAVNMEDLAKWVSGLGQDQGKQKGKVT